MVVRAERWQPTCSQEMSVFKKGLHLLKKKPKETAAPVAKTMLVIVPGFLVDDVKGWDGAPHVDVVKYIVDSDDSALTLALKEAPILALVFVEEMRAALDTVIIALRRGPEFLTLSECDDKFNLWKRTGPANSRCKFPNLRKETLSAADLCC